MSTAECRREAPEERLFNKDGLARFELVEQQEVGGAVVGDVQVLVAVAVEVTRHHALTAGARLPRFVSIRVAWLRKALGKGR